MSAHYVVRLMLWLNLDTKLNIHFVIVIKGFIFRQQMSNVFFLLNVWLHI